MPWNTGPTWRGICTSTAITASDISEYLASTDDFAFERWAYRLAKGLGFQAQHAALYVDPVTGKPRQFDVRATMASGQNEVALAIECKSLTEDFPLLVSCVPRERNESFHEFLYRDSVMGAGSSYTRVQTLLRGNPPCVYQTGHGVGKSVRQVRREKKGKNADRMVSGDEVFDKWTQSLASIGEMVDSGAGVLAAPAPQQPVQRIAFLPVLVVPDNTLWIADYSSPGDLRQAPFQCPAITFYLERKYRLTREQAWFTVTHLHIFTRTSLGEWLQNIAQGGGIWQELFPN
jgi:hypothetical protein